MNLILDSKKTSNLKKLKEAHDLLKARNPGYNWSFFKFVWNCVILSKYDTIYIKEGNKPKILILLRKNEQLREVDIIHYYFSEDSLDNVDVTQQFLIRIHQYAALNYEACNIMLREYDKKLSKNLINFTDFCNNTEKVILSQYFKSYNNIVLTKKIKNHA